MESVDEYKYVGVMVDREGSWDAAVARALDKGREETTKMKGWLGKHWGVSPRVKVEVWKGMVGSVMRYGSEVWFPMVVGTRDLEAVQLGWVKSVLRLNGGTTDEFVRGEVGLFELKRERDKSMLVWLGRLEMMSEDRWARRVYDVEWNVVGKQRKSWKTKVGELVRGYNLVEEFEKLRKEGNIKEWKKVVQDAVREVLVDEWEDG